MTMGRMMSMDRLRVYIFAVLTAMALSAPLAAHADSQPVSATVGTALGLTVSGPVTLLPLLLPGQTSTGSGSVVVVATGPWVLRLSDGASSNAGKLQRTVGSSGASVLSHALDWSTSGSGVTGSARSTSCRRREPLIRTGARAQEDVRIVPSAGPLRQGCELGDLPRGHQGGDAGPTADRFIRTLRAENERSRRGVFPEGNGRDLYFRAKAWSLSEGFDVPKSPWAR